MNLVAPRATLGILGGGQLARMLSTAAARMGFRVRVLDPDPDCPAALFAYQVVAGDWNDPTTVQRFAQGCDVITLDTEHVPHDALRAAEPHARCRPDSRTMAAIQDRAAQRRFLADHDLPAPHTAPVASREDLSQAVDRIGAPAILKTRTGGYDGKGQARIEDTASAGQAWEAIGRRPAILEEFVPFEKEISVLVARTPSGAKAAYEPVENTHRNGILHLTLAPARISPSLAQQAKELGAKVVDALGHVGVLAVELFVHPKRGLLVNEIAPRVHNSGHYTLGACATSQFEQHVRAVFGLALGDTTQHAKAAMLNLLGDLWQAGPPDWTVVDNPHAHLHLYGKRDPRPGRKMGHVTVLHSDLDRARALAEDFDRRLRAA